MSEPMPYGEMVQELTHLRAKYEQFIIDRERERIIKLLEDYGEKEYEFTLTAQRDLIALIKGEK